MRRHKSYVTSLDGRKARMPDTKHVFCSSDLLPVRKIATYLHNEGYSAIKKLTSIERSRSVNDMLFTQVNLNPRLVLFFRYKSNAVFVAVGGRAGVNIFSGPAATGNNKFV